MNQLKPSSSPHPDHPHRQPICSSSNRTPSHHRSFDPILANHSKHPTYLHPHRPPFLSSSPSSSPSKMSPPPLHPPSSPLVSSRHRSSTLRKPIPKSQPSSLHRKIQNFSLDRHPRSSSSSSPPSPSPSPLSLSPRPSSSSSSSFPGRRTTHPSSSISQPFPSSPIKSSSNPTSSLPVTPKRPFHSSTLLDTVLSSSSNPHHLWKHSIGFGSHEHFQSCHEREKTSLCQKLTRDGIHVTPIKLSRALSNLIAEKKSIKHGDKQVAMQNLIQTLQSLRSKPESLIDHDLNHYLEPQRKRIKIESAPDGSASVVVAPMSPERHHHLSDSIDPSKLFPSCNSSPDVPSNHQSSLVSADIQDYGRVAIKKEALIGKLGLEAALRAIRKAKRGRIHPHHPRRRPTPPSSPHTDSLRSSSIAKWLDSTDENDNEDPQAARMDLRSHPSHERFSTRGYGSMHGLTQFAPLHPADHSQPSGTCSDPSFSVVDDSKNELPAQQFDSSTIFVGQPSGCASLNASQPHLDIPNSSNITSHQHRSRSNGRPSTPIHQQSSFLNHTRPDHDNDSKLHHHPLGTLSHVSFTRPIPLSSSSNTYPGMLKPGCNLNQSFLSLAPSPTIMLSNTEPAFGGIMMDEKDSNHQVGTDDSKFPPSDFLGVTLLPSIHARDPISPQAFRSMLKNDYSPCSPAQRPPITKSTQLARSENSPMDRKIARPLDYNGGGSPTGERHWLSDLDLNRDHSNPHFLAHHSDLHRPASFSSHSNLIDRENHHLIFEDLFGPF